MAGTPHDWLKFNNREFYVDSRKEFRNNCKVLLNKEIKGPEDLDYAEFSTLQEGRSLQALEQCCHVSFRHDGRTFTSQALNSLFRIRDRRGEEEYVYEAVHFSYFVKPILGTDPTTTTPLNIASDSKPKTTMIADTLHLIPPSKTPFAKFLSDKAKEYKKKSMIVGAHLIGKLDDRLDDNKDEAAAAEARRAQEETCGVRHHPNISFTNRLRAMDEKIGDMDTNIFKLSNDVEELTTVVYGMSEQYDQFYEEFNTMREEQQRVYSWETDHLSQTPGAGPSTSQKPRNDMDEE
nr:hypothetical protein [Tanacetum cinerariifolium]